jgi:hypothetical protein
VQGNVPRNRKLGETCTARWRICHDGQLRSSRSVPKDRNDSERKNSLPLSLLMHYPVPMTTPKALLRFLKNPGAIAAISALAFGVAAFSLTSCGEKAIAAAEKTKIVFIAGKPSHPSGQHEFNAGAILLARALNEQSGLPLEVNVVHNGWPDDDAVFDGAKAVIIYSDGNANHPVNGHEEKMEAMLAGGVGLMCMHYGVEVPKGELGERFKRWIGGHYESGYSTNPHWTAEVELKKDHPISRGVPGFSANDEWYYNMRFADPKTSEDLGKRQTMMWAVERADGGRGVGFTGGHWHRNWAIDDFRRVVLNAIAWTAKVEVPEAGVTSLPVTEARLNENLDEKKEMIHVALPSTADLNQPAAEPKEFGWPGKQ